MSTEHERRSMRMGQLLRYREKANAAPDQQVIDGLPNYYWVTTSPRGKLATLEAGISPLATVSAPDGDRCPAVLIRSSPHKHGSETAPWQDHFEPDRGKVIYFGDNKVDKDTAPELVRGNRALLEQLRIHQAPEPSIRQFSAPLIYFRGARHEGRQKGQVSFLGVGTVERVERVTQWDRHASSSFVNYRFHCSVLSLNDENEMLDWRWINDRRDPSKTLAQSERAAPKSWCRFIADGPSAVPAVRRDVVRLRVSPSDEQRPPSGSREAKVLREIYEYYANGKHRFEALAEIVAERVLSASGATYKRGWLTPRGGDGGVDFIGRLDVGAGFASVRLVVLGQSKCEKLDRATGGVHIARTVARLRRGWIGVYVTTSYFSTAVQREVVEDEYPIVLIHGQQVAETVLRLLFERGETDVAVFLAELDNGYEKRIQLRLPGEILHGA